MAVENVMPKQADLACWETLLCAVCRVYERYEVNGMKAGSEHWTADSLRYRPQAIGDVFMEWSTITGEDKYFPWHDDFVCQAWLSWRKLPKDKKRELCEYFGVQYSEDLRPVTA